jgi:16S rRNA (cytosine967-C5)-methyltransferase
VNDPRIAAWTCLEAVDDKDAYANLAMTDILARAELGGRDAAFAVELAYGTIRMRKLYDAIIASAANRPVSRIEAPLVRVLRMGTHQVLGMRVPPHAAVDETVRLARTVVGERAVGFTNAVMRAIVAVDRDTWLETIAPDGASGSLATRYSHPEWIVEELAAALEADGRDGEIESLLSANNEPASVTLVALPLPQLSSGSIPDAAVVAADIPQARLSRYSPLGITLAGGDPGGIAAVRQGRVRVQDEGSQLAALALVAPNISGSDPCYNDGPHATGERWLDMCAGPGGKAALLGAVAAGRGATIDALDVHQHRVGLVRNSVRAVPRGVVRVHVADARVWEQTGYDRVLLDAPCTGLGALRRRPEARWRRSPHDLSDLSPLQRELLTAAVRCVRPGGLIAYVTCSPVLSETRDIIASLMTDPSVGPIEVLDARDVLATIAHDREDHWGGGPFVQLWTHDHGTDSMFISLLRRG